MSRRATVGEAPATPATYGRWVDIGVIAILTAIWGTTWAAIRVGLTGVPPLAGVGIRFTLAGAILLGIARLRGIEIGKLRRERRLWLVNGIATFAIPYTVIYWSEQIIPSGLSSVLFATFPLWVVVIGRGLLSASDLGAGKALALIVGFGGVALLFAEDLRLFGGGRALVASILMLIAPAISASGSVSLKKWGAGVPPISLAAMPMLGTGIVLGVSSLFFERDSSFAWTWQAIAATLYLSIFGSAVTFTLYFSLLARRSAVVASLVSYTAPVVAVLVGVLVFSEPWNWRLLAGGALVLFGVALVLRPGRRATH